MSLEALIKIAPPPSEPSDPGRGKGWAETERSLGTALPSDYKEFINLYGLGLLADHMWVYNPFSDDNTGLNLLVGISTVLTNLRHTRAEFGETECPYPLYPEPNGILPWAHVDTGGELFWQTTGDPDQWTVLVNESRGPEFEHFRETMTGLLAGIFSGRLTSDILPDNVEPNGKKVSFIPDREL